MRQTKWPGNWKVSCHVCGFWYPSGDIKKRWDGLLVCPKDYETRHPQTLIKIKAETAVPTFVSKDVFPDEFIHVCDIQDVSPYADMAEADCARVGNTSPAYSFLYDLDLNGHE